jgi:hypothetical protein
VPGALENFCLLATSQLNQETEPSMPENNVSDLITDQEIAFAHLIFSGTMTERRAAKAVGLHPNSANNIKSSSRVRAYMLKHQAAAHQPRVEQDTGLSRFAMGSALDGERQLHPSREQVLDRLWEIAKLSPEITRGSITGQVKAISMIIAIEGLIPDRRAASAQNKPTPSPVTGQIYQSEWLRKQRGENVDSEPPTPPAQKEAASEPQPASGWANGAPPAAPSTPEPTLDPGQPAVFAAPSNPAPAPSLAPRVPMADYVAPDTRVLSSNTRNPFARRR